MSSQEGSGGGGGGGSFGLQTHPESMAWETMVNTALGAVSAGIVIIVILLLYNAVSKKKLNALHIKSIK